MSVHYKLTEENLTHQPMMNISPWVLRKEDDSKYKNENTENILWFLKLRQHIKRENHVGLMGTDKKQILETKRRYYFVNCLQLKPILLF